MKTICFNICYQGILASFLSFKFLCQFVTKAMARVLHHEFLVKLKFFQSFIYGGEGRQQSLFIDVLLRCCFWLFVPDLLLYHTILFQLSKNTKIRFRHAFQDL